MGKIVTNKNYPSYPKEFQNNFKKLFKISYITEEGTIISEPNKLNLDAIELFDNFFYAYSSSYNRLGRSVKKNYNWNVSGKRSGRTPVYGHGSVCRLAEAGSDS